MTTTKLFPRHTVAVPARTGLPTTQTSHRVAPVLLFAGVARATFAFGAAVASTAVHMHGQPDPMGFQPAVLRS